MNHNNFHSNTISRLCPPKCYLLKRAEHICCSCMDIRSPITQLLTYQPAPTEAPRAEEEVIHVSPALKRVAFAYERFRNTLEPDEEDILRRKAIHRVLERRLGEDRSASVAAEQVLQELMRANYIEPVTRRFAEHIAMRLTRTKAIMDHLDPALHRWFLHLTAVTIDRDLYPRTRAEALVQLMFTDTVDRVQWVDDLVVADERPTQLYMASHRALFEADDYEITYHYFINTFPAWNASNFSDQDSVAIAQRLPDFYAHIQKALGHSARDRLSRLLRAPAVPYRITRDVVSNPEALKDPAALKAATTAAVAERTRRIRARMNKRAWHSILFLLFTKTILALLIEVPYEVLFLPYLHIGALAANIAFHPLLLFFLATTVRLPGANNTDRIVEEVHKVVTGDSPMSTIIIRQPRHYGAATWSFFALLYAVLFLFLFWGLFTVLDLLQFSLIATFMFVMFLGLVSFLAIRIRRSVSAVRLIPARESALGSVISFVSLPVLEFGRWLAVQISQLNVALFFMDRILEAPFKILIDIVEEWFTFVRERKEEIV